jgi:hypothetical protein
MGIRHGGRDEVLEYRIRGDEQPAEHRDQGKAEREPATDRNRASSSPPLAMGYRDATGARRRRTFLLPTSNRR